MKTVLFLIIIPIFLQANKYAVIVNKDFDVDAISKFKIKMIFLKKIKMVKNKVVLPINLYLSNPARISFEKNVLQENRENLNFFWIKQHYFGERPPMVLQSEKSVLIFVKKVKNAIAYIPIEYLNKDVKAVYFWEDDENNRQY